MELNMIKLSTKFEISYVHHCKNMKDNAKCRK